MPRRYLPHGQVLTKTGHPIPVLERFCRDLLLVPEWVRATEAVRAPAALALAIAAVAATPGLTLQAALAVEQAKPLAAAIAPVAMIVPVTAPTPLVQTVLYQVSYAVQIVTPATVSSEVVLTITWTENDIVQTYVVPAITGNTVDTQENDTGILIVADADSEVTVETSYASVGAENMEYDIQVSYEPVLRHREAA